MINRDVLFPHPAGEIDVGRWARLIDGADQKIPDDTTVSFPRLDSSFARRTEDKYFPSAISFSWRDD